MLYKLFCAFSFTLAIPSFGAELLLEGQYQGKNIYVQNPYLNNGKDFCTTGVEVNGIKRIIEFETSAFEIDLSYLQLHQTVRIKIFHHQACMPKVLNPQVIRTNTHFSFNAFALNEDHITWGSKGEKTHGKYFIEHFVNNMWLTIHEVHGKASEVLNSYTAHTSHHSGWNKYRVKYLDHEGQVYFSQVGEYYCSLQPVTYYPKRIIDKIYLSRAVDYELLDAYGNMKLKGHGKEVVMTSNPAGVYYLNADNRSFKLYKK